MNLQKLTQEILEGKRLERGEDAFNLLKKYNKNPFHIQHALTVEAVMKWYARKLGYGNEEEYWGIVGLPKRNILNSMRHI